LDGGYYQINREERNLAAIFYHVLLLEDNLFRFLEKVSCDFSVNPNELGIYFEYSYLRDLWKHIGNNNQVKRELIYNFLKPRQIETLKLMSTSEFNTYFGAVPRASEKYIQSPSNWSIVRFKTNIVDDDEFLKTCRFKWAFNAKPDIVIHTSHETAICIECKLESGEGTYPANKEEIREFRRRNLNPVGQTELQRYIMEDLLGIQTKFIFLVQKSRTNSPSHSSLLWKEAFAGLNINGCPTFIKEQISHLCLK
jgi:hypothetical protein